MTPLGPATVILNEIQPDLSTGDLIELYVTNGGTLNGITMYYGSSSDTVATTSGLPFTFPNINVNTGSYIIIHAKVPGTDKSSDIYMGTDNGQISVTDTIISLYSKLGVPLDMIAFSSDNNLASAAIDRIDDVNNDATGDDSQWKTAGTSAGADDALNVSDKDSYDDWAIHRDNLSTDTNTISDWALTEGHNTMGNEN